MPRYNIAYAKLESRSVRVSIIVKDMHFRRRPSGHGKTTYLIPRQARLPLEKLTIYLSRLTPSFAARIHRSGSNTLGFGKIEGSLLMRYVD